MFAWGNGTDDTCKPGMLGHFLSIDRQAKRDLGEAMEGVSGKSKPTPQEPETGKPPHRSGSLEE